MIITFSCITLWIIKVYILISFILFIFGEIVSFRTPSEIYDNMHHISGNYIADLILVKKSKHKD